MSTDSEAARILSLVACHPVTALQLFIIYYNILEFDATQLLYTNLISNLVCNNDPSSKRVMLIDWLIRQACLDGDESVHMIDSYEVDTIELQGDVRHKYIAHTC